MKISTYHSYDELPLFLNAELVAKVLGVSISSAYCWNLSLGTTKKYFRLCASAVGSWCPRINSGSGWSGRLEVPDENLDKARPGQELFSSAQ